MSKNQLKHVVIYSGKDGTGAIFLRKAESEEGGWVVSHHKLNTTERVSRMAKVLNSVETTPPVFDIYTDKFYTVFGL